MAPRITVRPDELTALAAELDGLADALTADGDRCRAAADALAGALGGREGAAVGGLADRWGTLAAALADGTGTAAGTLRSVAAAYRDVDAALAGRMGSP
ncbi:Uncharacterized conserved protein YukE [Blastococcus fimeti]|nr:Uncharacterized conserved protein YukE [Blastococcus fimeti]